MKILISADIEGVAGVFSLEQTRAGNAEYERARRWMTEEANAAIRGAFDGGATEVLVNDSHGSFRNLIVDSLHPRASYVLGKPRYMGMMAGLELDCDAVMLLGYHSQAQGRGVLAHTINSFAFARVEINGEPFGEAGLYGGLAAELGVPVIFGSGDDQFIAENKHRFPHAHWVQTKVAYGHSSGVSLSLEASQVAIAQAAEHAVRAYGLTASTVKFEPKHSDVIHCRLLTQGPAFADLFCTLPELVRIDGVTLEFSAPSMAHTIRMLNSMAAMSFMLR